MKSAEVDELIPPKNKLEDGEIIPPDKDNRGKGDIIPRKQPEPIKPGKKMLLND